MFVTVVRKEDLARPLIAGAVLFLHANLWLALLWANLGPQPHPQLNERITWLSLHTEADPRTAEHARRQMQHHPKQRMPFRPAQSPGIPVFTLPIEPSQNSLVGLHDQLFNCAPDNLANLDETQRSRCRKVAALPNYDRSALDYADRSSKVPGAKRWKRELARNKAPLLLPCASSTGIDYVATGVCIIENIMKGFEFRKQYENQPAYFDQHDKRHVENNGDEPSPTVTH